MATGQSLHKFPPMDLAEELVLRDAGMLRRIKLEEIHNSAWMHDTKASRAVVTVCGDPSSMAVW